MRNTSKLFQLLTCLLLLMPSIDTYAAKVSDGTDIPYKEVTDEITQNLVKAKIEAIKTLTDIDENTKAALLKTYKLAQDDLANIDGFKAKAAEFENAMKNSPADVRKLQRDIEQTRQKLNKASQEDFSKLLVEELEQRLILEKDKLTVLDDQVSKLELALSEQNNRPNQIRQETLTTQQALSEARKNLSALPVRNQTPELQQADLIQLKTGLAKLEAQLKMLNTEAESYPARIENLNSALQLTKLQKELLSPIVLSIENQVSAKHQQAAIEMENELTEAEKKVSGKHNLIKEMTRENLKYARDLQAVMGKIEQYTELKNKNTTSANGIESDFKNAEKRISLAGLSPVLGKILREQRRNLISHKQFNQDSKAVQEETALASLEQLKLEDKQKSLSDIDALLKSLISLHVDKSLPNDQRMMIQAELRVLLTTQKDLINKLLDADNTFLRTLGDYDFARQQLEIQINKFAVFLDEHLLWVPSSSPVNIGFISQLTEAVWWILSPVHWALLIQDTATIAWQNLFLTFFILVASLVLPVIRTWAKRQLLTIAEKIEKIYTDNFNYTLKALAFTVILVLPLPALLYLIGWFLSATPQVTNFSKAIGAGLQGAALPLFIIQFFYRLFAAKGIAVKHFQWHADSAMLMHRQTAWLRFVVVPAAFCIHSTGASDITSYSDSLGRMGLIITMTALSLFFARILHPGEGLPKRYIQSHQANWLSKHRYLWYPLIITIPVIVIGFAIAGFYLSALELQQKLIITIRLMFGLVIIYELVIRWLTFMNRQLALKNLRQRRKAATAAEKPASQEGLGSDEPTLPADDQFIDIPTINAQTIKLLILFISFTLIIGCWMIWNNILPAFAFLEHIVLWQHLVITDNQESYQPITLKNLVMAGLYAFVAAVSVVNISGLLELLVFSRISISAGGRYAVNQLIKYIIITIGFIFVANELGGSWSQVQWLVAALSVGIGFGLQEIFANFVSGIIILFERPIRIGDTVTISNVTGKVSRIQMRATTLIDSDHKELIVPNKTFITNQLINWTLSDATTRIVVPVIIAQGADLELAHKVMFEAVRATQLVLDDPAPSVVFTGFNEGGLEFSIRLFVSELANRLPVTHNLNLNLEKMLRQNQIHISFPKALAHANA